MNESISPSSSNIILLCSKQMSERVANASSFSNAAIFGKSSFVTFLIPIMFIFIEPIILYAATSLITNSTKCVQALSTSRWFKR